MRPKSTKHDLPTTHDILNHLHNKFVQWLEDTSTEIEVKSKKVLLKTYKLTFHMLQAAPGLVSTTADCWLVDTTKASFLGVTAHWIEVKDGKWRLRSEVIRFRPVSGEHSGET